MANSLDPELRRAVAARVRFYNELGIYDFYRRDAVTVAEIEPDKPEPAVPFIPQPEQREQMPARKSAALASVAEENIFEVLVPKPEQGVPLASFLSEVRDEVAGKGLPEERAPEGESGASSGAA